MKTPRIFSAAPVGPVSDRILLVRTCTCGAIPARPVGDRSYGAEADGAERRNQIQDAARGSEVRQNFEARARNESLGGFRNNWRRRPLLQGALVGLLVAAFLTGCGSGSGTSAHPDSDGHAHGAEPVPAVVFKAGYGLQLNATAAQFIGLATAEVSARDLPGAAGVPAIPDSALLRTVRGDFVFVANGSWLLRTPVTVGAAGSGWLEVKDGLYEGDTVVAQGTRALWLAEIQSVNGGVSCTQGH